MDEIKAASARARNRIVDLERELETIKVLEEISNKATQVRAFNTANKMENINFNGRFLQAPMNFFGL